MKRAVEILKKTQGKASFKRSGQPKKSTKYARKLEEQRKVRQAKKNLENQTTVRRMVSKIISRLQAQNTAGMTRQEIRNAERKALSAQRPVYNFEKQRNAVRELQQLISKTPTQRQRRARPAPAPEVPPGMGLSPKRRRVNNNNKTNTKRRRLNIGRPVRFVKKVAKKIANKARKKTAAAKTIQRAVRARISARERAAAATKIQARARGIRNRKKVASLKKNISPAGRLNSNFPPIVSNDNNNNRNANANVNVFRNKNNIVRVRRTSNNVHGTKNRWSHKLKTGSTSNNNLKNKHGNKNWHRHRPRGRYTSTTRCEFIAPKDALLRLASERGIQVNSKLSKAQICERLVNGS
jgi:hypothetical protein